MKILAKKTSSRHIIPVYTINEHNQAERVGNEIARKEKFPNSGSVIIHRDSSLINENYKRNELFAVEIEETHNFEEVTPNSCRYQSLHGNTSSIKKLSIVVESPLLYEGDLVKVPYSGIDYIFLSNGDIVYGPYSVEQLEYENSEDDYIDDRDEEINDRQPNFYSYRITDLDVYNLGLDNSYQRVILKFDRKQFEEQFVVKNSFKNNYSDSEYIIDAYVLDVINVVRNIESIDFILDESDTDIASWAENAFPSKATNEEFSSWISSNSVGSPVDRRRLERFLSIKDKSSKWLAFLNSYISTNYLQSDEGINRVNKYIEANRSVLLREIEDQLKNEAKQQLQVIEEEREEIEQRVADLKTDIITLETEKNRISNENEMIREQSEQLKKITDEIAEKTQHYKLLGSIAELKNEEKELQDYIYRTRLTVDELDRRLADLQKKNKEELNKTINELYPFVQAIVAAPIITHSEKSTPDFKVPKISYKQSFDIDQYINTAKIFLQSNNRHLDEADIINIVTCINQGFVTVFTGLPGVGKTSLARFFSQMLCPQNLSVEVAVGRGWNTKKNLLGYFNPIKNEYQNDEYGIIEKLQLYADNADLFKKAYFIVTLDEANLSPIEHYWSDFISLSDKESLRTIPIPSQNGNGQSLKLPDGFRFIFTINHDHTTELLSPRLIDRACFIRLHPIQAYIPASQTKEPISLTEYYSVEDCNLFFKPKEVSLTLGEKRIFEDILKILTDRNSKFGKQIIVSQRKIFAVYQYCTVTRELYKDRNHSQFLALDYAILQFILPLINGFGTAFESRLIKLKEELQGKSLSKSAQEIEDIINKGKDFQNFSFLS